MNGCYQLGIFELESGNNDEALRLFDNSCNAGIKEACDLIE